MRVDLFTGGQRPWYFRLAVRIATMRVGVVPGPPAVMTYRPDFFPKPMVQYFTRNLSTKNLWGKGNGELFAAFVSDQNTCHF